MGTIQIKRGLSQNLPSSGAIAEILYTTDTRKFYIGNGPNVPLTEFANVNQLMDYLSQKANVLHSHASSDIDDFSPAVDERIALQKGSINGIATLDSNGHIPTSQIPIEFKEAQVVADISARDELEVFSGLHALVVDATDDSTVETGGAEYIYDGTAWIKISELNDLDAVITWENILNKPYFVQTLLDLTDTPDSLEHCAGKVLGVNSEENGFTFLSVYTGDVDGGGF